MNAVETCENCGGAIGKLETPRVWNDVVVCVSCHAKLSAPETSGMAVQRPPQIQRVIQPIVQPVVYHNPAYVSAPGYEQPQPWRVQTIQKTGKFWKFNQFCGVCLCLAGVVAIVLGMQTGQSKANAPQVALGFAGAILGLFWFLVARLFAWWFHG